MIWELILLLFLFAGGILLITNGEQVFISNIKDNFTKNFHVGYIDVVRTSGDRYKISFYSLKAKQVIHSNISPLESENHITRRYNESEISSQQKIEGIVKVRALLAVDNNVNTGNTVTPQDINYIRFDVQLSNNVVYIKYYSRLQQKNIQDSTTPETLKNWLDTHLSGNDINSHQYNSGIAGAKILEERMKQIAERKDSPTTQDNVTTDTNIGTGLQSGSNSLNNPGLL